MKGVIKGIVLTILGLLGVVALAGVLLVTLVNPNDYRDDISQIAKDAAGVELKLGGDLSWRFYPVLGFGANDVELALQVGQPQLVKIGEMAVGVKLLPLLSKKIEIDALDIGGLHANLIVNEKGENNWQMAEDKAAPSTTTHPAAAATSVQADSAASADSIPDVFIPSIRIHDSSVQYQDKMAKLQYQVDLPLLELKNVNLKESFPLVLEARIRDQAKLDVTTKIQGNVKALLAQQQFGIDGLDLAANVAGLFAKPVPLNVQGNIQFDQAQDQAQINLNRLQFSNLVTHLKLTATKVSSAPAFSGELASDVFDAKDMLQSIDVALPTMRDADAMTRVELNAKFAGTPEKVSIKPLSVKLDATTLAGDVSVVDVSKQALRFTLQLDKLDADRYLPPPVPQSEVAAADAEKKPTTASKPEDLIPVELLRTLNVQGTFKAGEVVVQEIPIKDIALSIKALNGDVQINDLGAKLLQGTLSGSMGVDARQDKPKITTHIDLNEVEMSEMLKPFVTAQLLSGRTSVKVNTETQGNDMDTLLQQALGQVNFSMANTVVHGVNVNQVALDAVKSKLGDFATLMPDYEQKLPKALKTDTEIRNLLANMKVENGHLLMPDLSADTGEGQFSATGDIDLLQKGFDYRFGVVLSSLADNKYLKDMKWPVRCKGNLDSPVSDWCRPDSKAVSKALEQAATVALRDKGAQKLGEKLGLQNADETAVKEDVRQKAKAEEDKAKKKLSDSLNKKLNKFLEKE